ncbi:MAG: DNA mismatch repair protein MutS [Clostridiales bacterium]|nr:DNA mismatch repair protein MutS [Candidatus Apopatousia equi]
MSPMMTHYMQVKEKYKDAVVFYRLGDFYEMFFEDAVEMSKALELTLTGKDCGLKERAPMCGVPVKAMDTYVKKALELGYKIAICEQLSEPTGKAGEIVERDVVRVITSGTIMEDSILDEKKNNFILSVFKNVNNYGLAWTDITTGELYVSEINGDENFKQINETLTMIMPNEIISNEDFKCSENNISCIVSGDMPKVQSYLDYAFDFCHGEKLVKEQFNTIDLKSLGIEKLSDAVVSLGGLFEYLKETQKRALPQINTVKIVETQNYMHLDTIARKNLELLANTHDGGKKGSILWLLDHTNTGMGGRMLRKFISEPLFNEKEINLRLNGVEELYKNILKRDAICEALNNFSDIERICGKISYGNVNPRECLSLRDSLKKLPRIKELVSDCKSKVLQTIFENITIEDDVVKLLDSAISEKTPVVLNEGGIFKEGFNSELDELRSAKTEGENWVNDLEREEKEQTNIKNLKIAYNRVFGYYIEVTNGQKDLVPFRYQRKQTLSNAERYITPELKELENKILGAEEKSIKLEQQLFNTLREYLLTKIESMQNTSKFIAYLDTLCSLATVAVKNNYVKPKIVGGDEELVIKDGRHPIVELLTKEQFVPNDTNLNNTDSKTMIITGPNMAGKSTYMRQVAIITLLTHIGSFVPASVAQIPLTDRIFTRIGASDDLSYGQSTFMVEMVEVTNILRNATSKSLILLDEIGRGTSTFDGLSIAWSVMEYLSKNLSAKTLFSTHYHELTELEGLLGGVKNYRITCKEFNDKIIFLRKIVRGGANKSFGIEVASLAGLPKEVIERARELLKSLEMADINKNIHLNNLDEMSKQAVVKQNNAELINMIKEIDINRVSPIEAFSILTDLVERAKK